MQSDEGGTVMALDPKKHEMPTQDPKVRAHNFDEVALGYDEATAVAEASRCLNCKNQPCVSGCPVNIHIPDFLKQVREGNFEEAYKIITQTSSLPAVCGRVCPQESQCECKCTLGIKFEPVGIGRVERFVADYHNAHSTEPAKAPASNGHKVAVVGSGPSGLTCAGDLAKKGYKVTVYEALHKAGGVLVYGIPEFRLPKSIVAREVETLKELGVDVETNIVIGKTLTVDELFEMGYEAVFIGSGAGLPNFMNIPGEALKGVYSANEFLTRSNLMKSYLDDPVTPIMKGGKVAVVGGGNVAMDAARTALRLGAEKVYIVYRRSMTELPARKEEVEHAQEEGIEFLLLHNPVEILGYNNPDNPRDERNGFVTGMKCIKMQLGEPDEKGRRRPVPIEGSEFTIDVDTVVMAIGTSPNPLIKNTTDGLEVNKRGGIIVNEDGLTSRSGVYAGGDAVTGAATVISAMGAGKLAAKSIDEALSGK
jgi:glutamate synthase (NADPH/NADH) small chain